jgi:hypothetical protein
MLLYKRPGLAERRANASINDPVNGNWPVSLDNE